MNTCPKCGGILHDISWERRLKYRCNDCRREYSQMEAGAFIKIKSAKRKEFKV